MGFREFHPLFYITPVVYSLEKPFNGYYFLYAEPEIPALDNDWNKLLGNGNRNVRNKHLEAFAHFCYQWTEGLMTVEDFSGNNFVIRDPKIHTKNGFIINDEENLGDEGLATFFFEHHSECNMICKQLELKRPIWDENRDKSQDF